jgi:hypothetical protein
MNRTRRSGTVSSADRTTIAFDRYGDGRPVVVIGGAYTDRSTVAGVAEAISSSSVAAVTYDRRGRGASTNNDREFEPEREAVVCRRPLDERLSVLVREGRREDSVVLFSTEAVGLPTTIVEGMRATPAWGRLTALAHTLPYDLAAPAGAG